MNKQAFNQGFYEKCAEYGVDPQVLVKLADANASIIDSLMANEGGQVAGGITAAAPAVEAAAPAAAAGEGKIMSILRKLLAAASEHPGRAAGITGGAGLALGALGGFSGGRAGQEKKRGRLGHLAGVVTG